MSSGPLPQPPFPEAPRFTRDAPPFSVSTVFYMVTPEGQIHTGGYEDGNVKFPTVTIPYNIFCITPYNLMQGYLSRSIEGTTGGNTRVIEDVIRRRNDLFQKFEMVLAANTLLDMSTEPPPPDFAGFKGVGGRRKSRSKSKRKSKSRKTRR